METTLIISIVIISLIIIFNKWRAKKIREYYVNKYNDEVIADQIINKNIWQGQTKEQLIDSWGNATAIDQKVLKTKIRETWKYDKTGKNRYNKKVYLEDGIVNGWDIPK